ncbi:ExbD/TolR family protein [Haliangium ochraceum]|uniref:Biopolymer transport protein ExbD/TolR n=1 Tax=Haliangium ochraceum (strain DSM 14365 / JCM 11303 / SMP-2) TaxID=502025 RepID=D0LV52_HALO1|nr:biopolymer transporter ExbD [Haliangium ochraceum]ACY15893.1 Biopolymer transport protein ExbD/TolR [Haliangium ochraceum DSM 14365]
MNASQVRAKARRAMKRREEEVEQEEIEGGEINLIPYLDIVTNLMLFLLASISSGMILGQLNTTLPDRGPAQAAVADDDPEQSPNDKPLQLVVSVTGSEILIWSITGLEGTLQEPKARIPRTGSDDTGAPRYDYAQLNRALHEIASRRWAGELRKLPTFQAVLQPDGGIPYGTIIAVMDAMRCKLPEGEVAGQSCLLPSEQDEITKAEAPIDELSRLYDPARAPYDPERFALFHDILFSSGFE